MFWLSTIVACLLLIATTQQVTSCDDDSPPSITYSIVDERVPQHYGFDKLSERDLTIFKSKDGEYWQSPDQETSLRQVLLIHRHGDRTPITFAPNDKLANEPFWAFHGPGQLTNRGKARADLLGKIMRLRYGKFLGNSVNKNLRKSRSSGALRCIESAQTFLASFLALDVPSSPDSRELIWDTSKDQLSQLWQPASITTMAANIDGMLNEGAACKRVDKEYELINQSAEFKQLSEEFRAESKLLKEVLGFDTDQFYKWFWASSFLEIELSYMPDKVDPRLRQAYKRIERAGDRTLVMYQSTLLAKRLRAGLLVNDLIENMQTFRAISLKRGGTTLSSSSSSSPSLPFNKKFVHYSAHDLNLVVLLGMLDNIDEFPVRPDYTANIVFELHQDVDEPSEWFVRLYYMMRVPSKPIELHVAKCELDHPRRRCTLDKFNELMSKYKIDSWQSWMKECNNDLSKIDPYSANL